MANLIYWILAILMFGILVMLHEFGHFIAARLTGVTVIEFAIGFGPQILSKQSKKSGVKYTLRLLPFGGYCRFVGGEEEEDERPDAYNKQKIWKRALISICGPIMNMLTAIVLIFVLLFAVGLPSGTVPVIGGLLAGLPAEEAGFEIGDKILQIDGVDIVTTEDASNAILAAEGAAVAFVMERDGEQVTLTVQPEFAEDENPPRYMVGIQYAYGDPIRLGFLDSIGNAFTATGRMSLTIVDVLRDLITTGEGMEDLSGPIGTVTAVKEQTQAGGLYNYLYMAALISVNLGVFNLLPIPGLDGSKLIFLLIEKIRGKPLDPNKEGIVTLIGFALLMGLMVMALYQDIVRLLA